jgi:4-cresol dehydrogenase (hydroxylating)
MSQFQSARVVDIDAGHQQFLKQVRLVLGSEHVVTDAAELERRSRDPVPGRIQPLAFVYPGSTDEVSQVVRLADHFGVTIWPHGSGRNWGWSNSPTQAGAVVMILERMNRILRVDENLAYAIIEPGVTYESLNRYLKENGIKLWSDCTGGPPTGSVLGNALDRGVGVTTHGEHFASLCGLQVVLADGKVIQTGTYPAGKEGTRYTYKWGVGPYLDGIFSQGNLGVVTQGGVWLMPAPEEHLLFGFQMKDDANVPKLLNVLRTLSLDGVIPDKIRVTNDFAVLTLLTQWMRERLQGQGPITDADMKRLNETYQFSAWSFCSSVYGRKEHVAAVKKIIVRELGPFGKLIFIDDRKMARIERLLPKMVKMQQRSGRLMEWITRGVLKLSMPMVETLPPLYNIYKGIPTERIVRRAYFRSPVSRPEKDVHVAQDNVGLIWFGPLMPLEGQVVFDLVAAYRQKFHDLGFDCYITMLMLNARTIVPLMGIIYRTEDPAEVQRAVTLYEWLQADSLSRGYQQWRCGRLGWKNIYKDNPELFELNTKIKDALDPNHTISPGKYGIA